MTSPARKFTNLESDKSIAFRDAIEQLFLEKQAAGKLTVNEESWRRTLQMCNYIGKHSLNASTSTDGQYARRGFLLHILVSEGLDEDEVRNIHALLFD